MKEQRKNILFLCTGNSCRSQMAEGWGNKLKSDYFKFSSAGTTKHGLNPNAVLVMKESGVDISNHLSQSLDEFNLDDIEIIFTVCSSAKEKCPYVPGKKIIHKGFDDPPTLAKDMKQTEGLEVYRRVRNEIKSFIENIEEYMEN